MDTQTQIDRLIELAIIQRTELKQLVEQLPQLREHLNAEVEKVFEETEPQLRSELEEWTTKQTADKTAALGVALEAKIANLAKSLEISTQARYNAIIAEREENARLAAQAEAKIAEHAASLPSAVKEIVSAELARFPRAGEIDQLRKEFAEPRGLNPRGKWQAGETYNRLDLVTYNGDSFVSNIDGNTEKPSRNAANWTLNAARGAYGGGGGITSLNDVLNAPTSGQIIGSQNGQYVPKTLVAGANITINETASSITIIGDEGQISLNDGTAASPALFFTNDTDTGIYRPAANTLGISVSGTQVAYFDANGITTVGAGATFDGSVHAANGNANNPSLSFTSDDNTGFFRHQPDEIGITLGGTQKATLTSTTFSITPNLSTSGNLTVSGASYLSGNSWFNLGSYSGTRALNFYYTGTNRQAFISSTGGGNFNGDIKFGVNGSGTDTDAVEVARINSVGLHIGPAGNASAPLQIENATTTSSRQAATGLRLSSPAGSGQTTPSIEFTNSVGTGAAIDSIRTAASYASSLRFFTSVAGGDVPTLALTLDSSQNTTLAGNLTVSGGTLLFNQAVGQYQTFNVNSGGTGDQVEIKYQQVGNGRAGIYFGTAVGGLGYMRVQVGSSGGTTALLANSTGNLLIGTTTDSGQKLQVAGDAALTGNLTVSGGTITGGTSGLSLAAGGTNQNITLTPSGVSGLVSVYGNLFQPNLVQLNGGLLRMSNGRQWNLVTNATVYQLQDGSAGGNSFTVTGGGPSVGNFTVNYTTASTSTTTGALVVSGGVGVAGAVNVGGAIAIGNTVQTAASVASTHKVTVVIGGVTYYLLATNV